MLPAHALKPIQQVGCWHRVRYIHCGGQNFDGFAKQNLYSRILAQAGNFF